MRKFGANILQHPRGVCVDNKGRIVVVECKVMRVIIFDQVGIMNDGSYTSNAIPELIPINERDMGLWDIPL